MQRHRRSREAAVGADTRFWLEILRAQLKDVDQEILRGRPSGQALRDEMARMIKDTEDRLGGVPLKPRCDRKQSPAAWIDSILVAAELRSLGAVERHLVGATLQQKHPGIEIPNGAGFADVQTGRFGHFPLRGISYYVTASEGKEAIEQSRKHLAAGVHSVLLLPRQYVGTARIRAEIVGVLQTVSILAIEDFITQSIIEMSTYRQRDLFSTLEAIIGDYNRRVEEVETDMSLRIELT